MGAFQRHIVTQAKARAVDVTILIAFSYLDILPKEARRNTRSCNSVRCLQPTGITHSTAERNFLTGEMAIAFLLHHQRDLVTPAMNYWILRGLGYCEHATRTLRVGGKSW